MRRGASRCTRPVSPTCRGRPPRRPVPCVFITVRECFALRGEFLSERSERNQRIAGGRPERPRAVPSAAMALPPDPITGVQRPCVKRTLQNLMGRTLLVRLRNLVRFTGDPLYPHHDKLQNLFLMRLTAVACRGRPVRAAAESRVAQRGGAAGAGTTAHNWKTQARKDSGGDVPFSDHAGPGRPGRRGNRVRFCAPDTRNTSPIELPLGPCPQARRFFGYFCISTKVPRPRAKYPLSPVPPAGEILFGRQIAASTVLAVPAR